MKETLTESGPIWDFRAYEAAPGVGVIVLPDQPSYSVVAVSADFVTLFGVPKAKILGKGYLQFLQEVGYDADGTLHAILKGSFDYIIKNKTPHYIPPHQYEQQDQHGPTKYWEIKNVPIIDDETGAVSYVIQTIVDVTARVHAESRLASIKDIEKAYKFFMHAPVIIGYVRGEDYQIEIANNSLLEAWQVKNDVIGKSLFKVFPELESQGFRQLLDNVRTTGKPFFGYEHPITFTRDDKQRTSYFDFIYQPFYEEDSKIASGIISIGHDVTDKVKAKQTFRNIIEQAQDSIVILRGEDLILEVGNQTFYKRWGLDESANSKPLAIILPQMKTHGLLERVEKVYREGTSFQGYEMPITFTGENGITKTLYLNFTCQPYREANGEVTGVIVISSDATSHVTVKKQYEASQRKWKDLANSMPVMVWTTDAAGNVNFFNHQWYEFTGLTEEASLGFGWTKVLHPLDRDPCLDLWRQALQSRSLYEVEARYLTKSGSYVWCISRGVPITENGIVTGWYGTSTDIDKHKQLESNLEERIEERTKELEEKNKLLDSILRYSSNGISVSEFVFDDSDNVIDAQTILANDAAVNFVNLPKDLYLSKPATFFDSNIMRSPYGKACIQTLKTGEPFIMQYFLEYSSKWLELTVSKMDDHRLIHNFTDVTPIKEAQLKIEKSVEDLRFANANLEEFAYAASHDLKEPMRKIRLFSNQLQDGLKEKLSADQVVLFERLDRTANRMQKLVSDLLEYSQAAKGSIEKEEVNLASTIENVLEDLELEIKEKNANIRCGALPTIHANKRQLHQMFQNLISNALKYGRAVVNPQIEIQSKSVLGKEVDQRVPLDAKEKLFYLIQVKDNGIGFDPKEGDRIFNVFTRLHTGSEYRGSGIGLSIVKKVVEAHSGFVWPESQPGQGSTFNVLLPV